ncbi:cytidylate kinase [Clostridiales bacterium CHKCI006]|nr:cytidylate kinase [Clostridiales bacterium CHKCI006]
MSKSTVIAISRQYGSGGREIGKRLAEKLHIPFYDKELILLAAKESGYDESLFEKLDEENKRPLSYLLSMYSNSMSHYDLSLNDQLFLIQSKVISDLAKESCVIIGRCADYVLRNQVNVLSVFIHAPIADRLARSIDDYHDDPETVSEKIRRVDKNRATYYNYYANEKWGQLTNYDLTMNSSILGIDGCVDVLYEACKHQIR